MSKKFRVSRNCAEKEFLSEEKSDNTKGQMQREEMSSSANRKVQ